MRPRPSTRRAPRAVGRALVAALLAGIAAIAAAFDLQGHRGARGLEPENTLAAFERALAIGVTTLEMDAAVTADGVVVVSHDPALNPAITRDAQGRWLSGRGPLIRRSTFAELQAYDVGRIDPSSSYAREFATQQPRDGQRLPRLADVFERVKALGAHDVRFDIETKINPTRPDDTLEPEPFVRALLAVIHEAGMTRRVMVQSFDWRTLQLLQKLEPAIETVYLTSRRDALESGAWTAGLQLKDFESVAHMVKASGGRTWAPNFTTLTHDAVKSAQALGLKVVPWTVNHAADADRLIGWGVDGIISDYPDRIRELMKKRGMPLPAAVVAKLPP
ncbi:MAG TPA: glycerophosphodiester phosphodiesterase [Caldimonas sp.]|jgi:glycerophosphoryl diester phosphodiesterase|nr:glycerophosphodiester phosphodiesterase [Caldimonas sp.]HEX2539621.1 glycerophosphodiester phosphodiesterase [Caldimonas sp.]